MVDKLGEDFGGGGLGEGDEDEGAQVGDRGAGSECDKQASDQANKHGTGRN